MLTKLAYRNAKRSLGDYLIYILTMVFITALMLAFHYMIFSEDVKALYADAGIMAIMVGLASFFVIFIVIWLVHYMVRFMADKRSQEFATYLLIGFRKKEVARLFLKENMLIGFFAFCIGILPGIFLQQVMASIIYAIVGEEYNIKLDFSWEALSLTAVVYAGAFLLALIGNNRRFKKMNIQEMMYAERKNQQLRNGNKSGKKWMLFASIAYMLFFAVILYSGSISELNIWLLLLLLIASIYLFYVGLSAFFVYYVKRGKGKVWEKGNIFIFRQLSSKIRTIQLTLGTLTILFMVALVGASCGLMLNEYQNTQVDMKWPFDVAIYNNDPEYNFAKEEKIIEEKGGIEEAYRYQIYQNGTSEMNTFLKQPEHKLNAGEGSYYKYDTYLKLSDYNHLRTMLEYEQITLKEGEYAIHIAARLKDLGEEIVENKKISDEENYSCKGIYTEGFEQAGHNGADYVLILPDETVENMKPYYSLMMVSLKGSPHSDLEVSLVEVNESSFAVSYETNQENTQEENLDRGIGTEMIVVSASPVFVREIDTKEMKYMLSAIIFPLFYIGLVFVCVALTVLAVQQLSDMKKQRYRYSILRQLGMRESERSALMGKQLILYYGCPFGAAILLSVGIVGYISYQFNFYTGVSSYTFLYLGKAALLLGVVYLLYFAATYIELRRNIERD